MLAEEFGKVESVSREAIDIALACCAGVPGSIPAVNKATCRIIKMDFSPTWLKVVGL